MSLKSEMNKSNNIHIMKYNTLTKNEFLKINFWIKVTYFNIDEYKKYNIGWKWKVQFEKDAIVLYHLNKILEYKIKI